jgi:subtilisin family serine protease
VGQVIATGAGATTLLAGPGHLPSQGAFKMGAETLWALDSRGAGQTVAIVDLGFGGLQTSTARGVLPPASQMVTQSFDLTYGIAGRSVVGDPTQHGVRVAEIVHSVAPKARLVLVNYHTMDEFVRATRWIADRRIPIVAHSNSFLTAPYDGTGIAARAVDVAAQRGVLWVNSAGNFARRHWTGAFSDGDGDGLEDFDGGNAMPIAPERLDRLLLVLSWPRGRGARYALIVQRRDSDGVWRTRARGDPAVDGRSQISYRVGEVGSWRLAVMRLAGPAVRVDIFSRTIGFGRFAVARGSIATPADAKGAIAVGATVWESDRLTDYSSNGPTVDGRLKPDLVAPTDVTVHPGIPVGGTSAAAPHVAGAAALLRQRRQARRLPADAASLRRVLTGSSLDLGPLGADPAFGAGRVRLDTSPPVLRVVIAGRTVRGPVGVRRGTRPLISIRVNDRGRIGGLRILQGTRLMVTVRRKALDWRAPALARGTHRFAVQADDLAGNTTRQTITLNVR